MNIQYIFNFLYFHTASMLVCIGGEENEYIIS